MGRAVGGKIVARSHEDKANKRDGEHEGEANGTIPKIENLGNWHGASGGHDVGHDADDSEK